MAGQLSFDKGSCNKCYKCIEYCPNHAVRWRDGPTLCVHCDPDKAPCRLACKLDAVKPLQGGVLTIDAGVCRPQSCDRGCLSACPHDAVAIVGNAAVKCDLCFALQGRAGFKVKCAEVCTPGAIRFSRVAAGEEELSFKGWNIFTIPEPEIVQTLGPTKNGRVVCARDEAIPYYYVTTLPMLTDELEKRLFCTSVQSYIESGSETDDPTSALLAVMKRTAQELNVPLDEHGLRTLTKVAAMNTHGFGPFSMLLDDDQLEELMCVGLGRELPLYVFHREHGMLRTNIYFPLSYLDTGLEPPRTVSGEDVLWKVIEKMIERMGLKIDRRHPRVNAQLPDGSRLHACISPVGFSGPAITIRKFRANPISPTSIVKYNTLSAEAVAYMWTAFESDVSMIIGGNTGSGKTTTLNALASFIPMKDRIIILESTPEINLPHPHKCRLVTTDRTEPAVRMQDLIEDTLRMRPDKVLVGEVRSGEEAQAFMNSVLAGQARGSMCTMHAQDAISCVKRLKNPPMNIAPMDLQSLDLIFIQRRTMQVNKERNEKVLIRRVMEIAEVDRSELTPDGLPRLHVVYRHDSGTDKVERSCDGMSPMERRIADETFKGMTPPEFWRMYLSKVFFLDYLKQYGVSDLGQFIDCVVKFNREAEYRASFEAMADDYLERAPRHMVPKELRR